MNIGFDAKRYFHNRSGLGNYSRDLVDHFIASYPANKYYLFDDQPSTLNLPANTIAAAPQKASPLWRVKGILKDLQLHNIDLYHGLSNELPFGKWPEKIKKVVTIHDVIFKMFPSHYRFLDRAIYDIKTKHALEIADKVIATSHACAQDIQRHYNVDSRKIQVVYQTCGDLHWKEYSQKQLERLSMIHGLPDQFLLYVSSFQTRKNHLTLLEALKRTKRKDIHLVLVGKKGPTLKACIKYIKQNELKQQVMIITDLEDYDLPMMYRRASGFVYPSMMEGFGIPLIEAACAGLPMAVNDIPVFRELAPKSTLKFDSAIIDKLTRSLLDLVQMPKTNYGSYLDPFKPNYAAQQVFKVYSSL